ncbi:MAG: hypothetical protein ABEJ67_00645 [Halanaeroarchaeum sp.]
MSLEQSGDERNESDGSRANTTRRKLMAAGAASWATVGLAGCATGGGQSETTTTTTKPPETTHYVVTDDMAVGSEGVPGGHDFLSACSPSRKFTPGMQAIWYVGVYNPETGKQLTDEELGKNGVEIHFKNRNWDPVKLGWAGDDKEHPAQEWGGSIVIPKDAQPGEVKYEVQIPTKPENSDFKRVGIATSSFTILEPKELTYVVSNYTYAISSPKESGGFVSACGPEWQFAPGMTVAFAANIFDANTGKEPGPDTITSAKITFPNGEFDDIKLAWQGGEDVAKEHREKVWEGVLELPDDAEKKTYTYNVEVTAKTGSDRIKDVAFAEDTFTVV